MSNVSPDITIIGLGDPTIGELSDDARQIIKQAKHIYVNLSDVSGLNHISDHLIPIAPTILSPDSICDAYTSLIETLINTAPVIYLVPGDPLIDNASTSLIQQAAINGGLSLSIIPNTPTLPQTLNRLNLSPGLGLQILDATLLCSHHYPPLEPHRPILITSLYHAALIAPIKKTLLAMLPPQTKVQGITSNGTSDMSLDSLDTSISQLYIPAQTSHIGLSRFQDVIAHLRAPSGCPWDKKQTHLTLRPYLLEEAYEVLAAIDAGVNDDIADELGDLLLQIVLHAQIANDDGTFQMQDIIRHITEKMIRRHPHVFADVDVSGADEVLVNWQAIKAQEKANSGDREAAPSAMDGVALTMPALSQALDISKKAVKQGFEWDSAQGVLRKLLEEAEEIATATTTAEIESEIGDFLFTAVNLARKFDVDAETALRACNHRFMRRFRHLEAIASERDLVLSELDAPAWFDLWQEAKRKVAHLEK